jgi:hypothetical protein
MKRIVATLAVAGAIGAAAPAADAHVSTCHLKGVPITNVRTNAGCGTADFMAEVEYYLPSSRHWMFLPPRLGGPAQTWHVTWRTVSPPAFDGHYLRPQYIFPRIVYTARFGNLWATFESNY